MANLRPKGRSKEHIGLDNKEALAAYLGKPAPKRRSPAAGKGDNRRPTFITDEEFEENWERTFQK